MSDWIHIINPFDVATKGSRIKMLILVTDHTSRLQGGSANPLLAALHTRIAPLKSNFSTLYSSSLTASAQWKAETKRVNNALKTLSGELIEDWDIRIQAVFKRDTPEYISLLPNYRGPFQQGSMDEIISHVEALGNALGNYPLQPALVTLKGEVDDFHEELEGMRDVQQQKEQAVKDASTNLDTAREAVAVMMFRNFGALVDIFGENPGQVLDYFQIDLLRSTGTKEVEYTGILLPDELKNVVNTGINQESSIFVKNTGDTAIEVSLSDNPDTMNPDATQTLQPNEEMTATGDEIPELSAYFINIRNTSAVQEGSYQVIII